MNRRRMLLGTALIAPIAVALPAMAPPSPSPDAALLTDCARWHELIAIIDAPNHPERDKDVQDLAEWPEWVAVEQRIETATPATLAGMIAMARVALVADGGLEDDDDTPTRIAHRLLLTLVGEA